MPFATHADTTFLVDKHLRAVALANVLDERRTLVTTGTIAGGRQDHEDLPVLMAGDQLVPGELYPAERNLDLRFYLPVYQIAEGGDGGPAVELEFIGDEAEAGRISITLTWEPMASAGHELRVMDHVANLEIVHRVPVRNEDGTETSGSLVETSQLQPATLTGSNQATSVTVFGDRAAFQAVYQAMRSSDSGAELVVKLGAEVKVRTWKQVVVSRPKGEDLTEMIDRKQVAIASTLQDMDLSRVTLAAVLKPERVLVKPRPPAPAPEISMPVAAGEVRPVVRARTTKPARSPLARGRRSATVHARQPNANPVIATQLHANITNPRLAGMIADVIATPVTVAEPERLAAESQPARAVATTRMVAPMLAPNWAKAFAPALQEALAVSDLKVAGKKAVPVQVAVEAGMRPALLDVDAAAELRIPFVFPPTENPGVYRKDENVGELRFLIQRAIHLPDGSTFTVLQDNVLKDVIHLPPTEFRLGRDDTAPFLPRMSFVLTEVTTTEGDVNAEVLLRAHVVYELEPWTDPAIVETVRIELAQQGIAPVFTVVAPTDARYTLDGEERPEAEIDPEVGIRDVLELDASGFIRLVATHLAGPGVAGQVTFTLFDGSEARAGARLSLVEESAALVDVGLVGAAGTDGQYTVRIRNRIESPVAVTRLPPLDVAPGVQAMPVAAGDLINRTLAPMESVEVVYALSIPDFVVADLHPTVLARPAPDVQRLCAELMRGTSNVTSVAFDVPVAVADGVFSPTADPTTQLTGLLVEFDDGTDVTLTPDVAATTVSLVGRLLDQVFAVEGEERAQRFFYRVTNLHLAGEGARSSWQEGHATAPVTVAGVVASLPF